MADEPPGTERPRTSIGTIVRNALFGSGGFAIYAAANVIATPYIVHKLTIEGYGIYALLTGLVGYYGLLDLGLGQGITKFVSEYRSTGNDEGISHSLNAALCIQLFAGGLGSALLAYFAGGILRFLRVSPEDMPDATLALYAAAVGFLFTMLSQTLGALLKGIQRDDWASGTSAALNFALIVAIVIALALGAGLQHVLYITAASSVLMFAAYMVLARRLVPAWRVRDGLDWPHVRRLFTFSGFLFFSKISTLFNSYIVRFVVSAILGPQAVTYYVVPLKLLTAVIGLIGSAVRVVFPVASELHALGDEPRIRKLYVTASQYCAAVAVPGLLAIAIFAKPILTLWMGAGFAANAWIVLTILAFNTLLGLLTMVPNMIAMGLGRAKLIFVFSAGTVLSFAAFVPAFTQLWGVNGTAIGMLCSSIPSLILLVVETKWIIRMPWSLYAREALIFHVVPLLAGIAFIAVFGAQVQYSLLSFILAATGMLGTYALLMVRLHWISLDEILGYLRQMREVPSP